jgi:hypothetical protein
VMDREPTLPFQPEQEWTGRYQGPDHSTID